MALVLKCGGLFLHVPKTGGSWVRSVLEDSNLVDYELGDKHGDMRQVLYYAKFRSGRQYLSYVLRRRLSGRVRPRPTETYYKFCFLRHPLAWYESWWRFNADRGWPKWGDASNITNWHPNAELNELGDPDFNVFVRNVATHYPGYVTDLYGRYTNSIDFIGEQKTLADDLVHVLTHLNASFDEDRIRSSQPANVSPSERVVRWDPALRREVERLEYAGIVRYGYQHTMTGGIVSAGEQGSPAGLIRRSGGA